jgi:hypothetical protein
VRSLTLVIAFWNTLSAIREFGYDGFGRNSFIKSATPDLWWRFRVQLKNVGDYEAFILPQMQR